MRSVTETGRIVMAISVVGLGLLEFVQGDFIGRWQPVPVGPPVRQALVVVSASVLAICGGALIVPRSARIGALGLAMVLVAWLVGLHAPVLAGAPLEVVRWVYAGEILAITCGALTLWSGQTDSRTATVARVGFAMALLTFGVSHFVYLKAVAGEVPAYFPARTAIAAFTGAAHLVAGAALLLNVASRLAARLEALMLIVIALVVNGGMLITQPSNPRVWTVTLTEGAMVGAAIIIAGNLAARTRPPR